MNYLQHFNLISNPFTTGFYYKTKSQDQALIRLNMLLESGGIMHIYGNYGVGKTLLLKHFSTTLPNSYQSIFLEYTALKPYGLLLEITNHLGLRTRNNTANLVLQIHKHINESNRNIVLIVDEAQELSYDSLESLKLIINPYFLTNKLSLVLSTTSDYKKQISGCPGIKQRIFYNYHIAPLDISESKDYFWAALDNVNCPKALFSDEAINKIITIAEGVPRLINRYGLLCLIDAASSSKKYIDIQTVENIEKDISHYE